MNTGDIVLSQSRPRLRRNIINVKRVSYSQVSSISLRNTLHYRPSLVVFSTLNSKSKAASSQSGSSSSSTSGDDFVTRVLKENPSQVETRFLVGDQLYTSKERQNWSHERGVNEDEGKFSSSHPVYLNNLLRQFKGKLYVPEQVFSRNLSEEEEFDTNLEILPRMTFQNFLKALGTNQVQLLTSKAVDYYGYKDFIVHLKQIPGDKTLQETKWAMKLNKKDAKTVLEQYTGPQYEIEKHNMSYTAKLPQYPHPVASSISSRMVVELGVFTALIAAATLTVGGFFASAVFAVTSFLFLVAAYVVWPLAKPILNLVFSLVFGILEKVSENLFDVISVGDVFAKLSELYTVGGGSANLVILKPVLFIFLTMVLLIRFTLSRKPKNFKKWDIWQGIQFGQSKPQARVDGSTGVSFSDVAGIEEAVEELKELVRYLKNPELFDKVGIKPPHGVLLEGPPGCGKTLVAKAIAGEAGVPFYQMAGSEFVEVLVGVGSARVRDLFKRAKVNKPSVIFIDEIDALATRRQGIYNESTNYLYNAATQERETTLNQLLIELDGFDTGKGVIFLGATNRRDLLDPALLRPGRFDRKIRIRPPGVKGRLDILKVHARKVKMSSTVDLSSYAQNLPGWTGAKLAQLLQEAALVAVRRGHESILQSDVDDAVDRLTVGPKSVGIDLGHQGQSRRATTEVGTAMTSHLLRHYDNAMLEFCERISINPRGQTFSQIVFRRMGDESYMFERRPQLLHRLQVLLGGRAAEEVIYGRDTSRASVSYLADASWLARKIITIWNLESSMTINGEPAPWRKSVRFVGPRLDFEGSLYDDYDLIEPPININLDDEVAERTEKLICDIYGRTVSLLRKHHAALLKTVKVLLDKKEISGEEIDYIINQYPQDTPINLLMGEENPGSLAVFDIDQGRDFELSLLRQSKGEFA